MKKFCFLCLSVYTLLLTGLPAIAQHTPKERIAKYLTDYFFLERENIHVHLDKNTFMADEKIWFKGYVYHRKKNIPFFSTINIYASLLDSDGKTLDNQLLYGNIGSFSGSFTLGEHLKSGKYYVRFYTNWMNNFTEDESCLQEITIINPDNGVPAGLGKPNSNTVNINFHPEGGALIQHTANSIGISIADCNNNPLPVSAVDIVNALGEPVKQVQVNKLGYGRFDLPAGEIKGYKAVINLNGTNHEATLPVVQLKGIALEINNYTLPDKTIVKIRTNSATLSSLNGKPVYIVAQQDEKAAIFEVNFNDSNLEQTLVIPSSELFQGTNTIRIIDSEMNQLAERILYRYPAETLSAAINRLHKKDGRDEYKGKVNYPNMNLSISVLPENTLSLDEDNDIYGSFLITPYIETGKKAGGKYYFAALSKGKHYELDLFLLNQKSKYQWKDITMNPPKSNYPFDMGLSLKGVVNQKSPGGSVRLYSLTSGIDETVKIENNEFVFHNLVIPDSAYVNFTLLQKGEKPKELKVAPQILNGGRRFTKAFKPSAECETVQTPANGITEIPDVPKIYKNTIELEEITIEATRLKYANSFGNGNLRGYKISEQQTYMYQSFLNYLKAYGQFNVNDRNGEVQIYTRTVNSISAAQSSPIIYLDNVQLLDYSMLSMIQMSEIDELYMNPHAIVPSVRNYMGVIKIYLKKGTKLNSKNTTPDIVIKNGFKRELPFENITYLSTSDRGYQNFGIIDWHPVVMTDEKGEFNFTVPATGLPVKMLIEGFSADGRLISQVISIPAQ